MSDLATIYAKLVEVEEELRKIPKSDSDIVLNTAALASIRTALLNTIVPASPIAGSLQDILSKAAGGNTFNKTTDSLEAIADAIAAIAAIVGPAKTLSAANDTVEQGFYAATTLDAVDADLAAGNIKHGVTIFGKAGSYDTEAGNPITAAKLPTGDIGFVNGTKVTGSGTKALSPANDTVEAGYYAGTTLDAVDADLAAGNIKHGVTIFGKAGSYDTEAGNPITAAKLPTGDIGFVNGAKVTGSGTKTLNPANDTVDAGYYEATTLHAVDADLATGNIKSGATIFGIEGAATVQDISDADAVEGDVASGKTFYSITGARKTGTAGA